MTESNNNTFLETLVCCLTIISTVLTQVPALAGYFRPIMYAMWILTLVLGLIINRFRIHSDSFLFIYIIVVLIIWTETILNLSTHSDSYIAKVVPLPLLCYLVGVLYSRVVKHNTTRICLAVLLITSFLMFSYIFATYIGNFGRWFNASTYIYEQKNSAAQIIGCTIIISDFLIKTERKWIFVVKNLILIFMFLVIVAMQSRAALISLIVTAIVYYFIILRGKKRFFITVLLLVILVAVLNNGVLSRYVVKAFIFNDRQTKNLDNFTSGRLSYFVNAWGLFKEHPIIGTGHHRVDNLYLCVLSDVGLVGFIPVIVLWITRICKNVAYYFKNKNPFSACVLCLTVFYFCESFAEAYPPFGPGVCAFMFWILCSFVDTKYVVSTSILGESETYEELTDNSGMEELSDFEKKVNLNNTGIRKISSEMDNKLNSVLNSKRNNRENPNGVEKK